MTESRGGVQKEIQHPNLSVKSDRLSTYQRCSKQMTQSPEELAEAGLFYTGIDDEVQCFTCGGFLTDWIPDDCPWVEHAKWFPHCPFVRLVKGEQFIRDVQKGHFSKCPGKSPVSTSREVLAILPHYTDLQPRTDKFVFNDGTGKQLLNLRGTIPVHYKGYSYNIPVCIWIMDEHVMSPPMAYVDPTSTMQIIPTACVDANGKVDLPYLRQWIYGVSDLRTMIDMLTVNLSKECPVYSKNLPQGPGGATGVQSQYPAAQMETRVRINQNSGTVTEAHEGAYLPSAVKDKIKRRLKEIFAQARYQLPESTSREVLALLAQSQYTDLRPRNDKYVFNDGTQKQLLNLEGALPVPYRGNSYNIPVCIWILDTHPMNPPMAYVKPTSTMQIKPNAYVDANGKVDLPYLRQWKYGLSDLKTLIDILIVNFIKECPVFSKDPVSRVQQSAV